MNTIIYVAIGGMIQMFIILLIAVGLGFLVIKLNIDKALLRSRFVVWMNEKLKENKHGSHN